MFFDPDITGAPVKLPVDLSAPSLPGLAYLLRHRDLWPEDFGRWNYADIRHCGVWLAKKYWHIGLINDLLPGSWVIDVGAESDVSLANVTPEMVAEHIERMLP